MKPESIMYEAYLGDAVLASYDGEQILLRTTDGNNNQIYLDAYVTMNLERFIAELKRLVNEGAFDEARKKK